MKFAAVCLFLLVATSVSAQTPHPCDVTPAPNPVVVGRTFTVGFCHNGKDLNGDPTTVTAFKIYLDGAVVLTWSNPTPSSPTPNSKGYVLYLAPQIPIGRGAHTFAVTGVNVDGEGPSINPIGITTKVPPPSLVIGAFVR